MKAHIIILLPIIMSIFSNLFAQVPQKIDYQAIVRDNEGITISDQSVNFRFSIHSGTMDGQVVYQEEQNTEKNQHKSCSLHVKHGNYSNQQSDNSEKCTDVYQPESDAKIIMRYIMMN